MKDPDPTYEKKILLEVIEQLKDVDATGRKQETMKRVILGAGSVGLVMAFFLAINGLVHPIASAFVAAAGGCAMGFSLFLEYSHKQWPVTRKHIDIESVRDRLEELEG